MESKTLNYYGGVFLLMAFIALCFNAYDGVAEVRMFSILAVSSIYHVGSALMKKLESIHADILTNKG